IIFIFYQKVLGRRKITGLTYRTPVSALYHQEKQILIFSQIKNKVLSPASRDSTELMGNGRPYPDYYFIELDLITKQEREILLKESNIWGMGTIYIFDVFNIKDEQ
ncbi:hypothetical protein H5158_09870, partial [Pseudoalteromonas sp. SR45-6]|nr:hypothetical protein [Pseudoalteromonas sp. SR45-6]